MSFSNNYIPSIQGLRALAILAVVACHAKVPGFSGGFIGVDIFFVLSGYLITGLLVTEYLSTGKINFLRFYLRRFRRLLPALILMLCVTSVLCWIVLAPMEQVDHVSAAQYASIWLSNLYFGFSNSNYFDLSSMNNMFLHTWSLGVEEQFYLIWPLLILLTTLMNPVKSAAGFFKLFCILAVISFSLCIYWSFQNQPYGFYLMPSRAWQFSLGALIYLLNDKLKDSEYPSLHRLQSASAWVGLVLVSISTYSLDQATNYPGFYSLLPSFGCAAILFRCNQSQGRIQNLLSIRPLQFIGDISYSLYLWHWPVLIFGRSVLGQLTAISTLALLLLSFALSVIAFYSIENPIRRNRYIVSNPGHSLVLAFTFMLVTFSGMYVWGSLAVREENSPGQIAYKEIEEIFPILYPQGCDYFELSARINPCTYGPEDAEVNVVLFGDSIGVQWFSAFVRNFVISGWHLTVHTKSACPIVNRTYFWDKIHSDFTVCDQWRDDVIRHIAAEKPEIVLIGSSTQYPFSENEWRDGTMEILDILAPSTTSVYLIRGTYMLNHSGPSCLARKAWQPAALSALLDCDSDGESEQDRLVWRALQQAAENYANVSPLDFNELVCPANRCSPKRNGTIVYRDAQHISPLFALEISGEVIEIILTHQNR